MSFQGQELALLALLFDTSRQQQFCQEGISALADFGLTEAELADFAHIRPDGLQLDSRLRIDLILSSLCRSYPLSFSLLSSYPQGLALLHELIDLPFMLIHAVQRQAQFGQRLYEALATTLTIEPTERETLGHIVQAETDLALSQQLLKKALLQQRYYPDLPMPLPEDWLHYAIQPNAGVTVALLPQPYQQLKQHLCPCTGAELWRRLQNTPLPISLRQEALAPHNPRLFLAKASVIRATGCDPVIEHQTLELSEGFAPLWQHLDGTVSTQEILQQMAAIGANQSLLRNIKTGFHQLLERQFLTLM